MTSILAGMDFSDLYWVILIGGAALAKLGKWIRDRSAERDSPPPEKAEKPARARKASSAPPARAFPLSPAPVAKPVPMMDRLEAGLAQLTKPAVGPTRTATRPSTPASRRPDGKRTVAGIFPPTPARMTPPASPGPRKSTRKRRPTEPRRAPAEAVAQIARVMQSRDTESQRFPSQETEALTSYGLNSLSIQELRRAVVLREILDPPLALRKPDAGQW